jgi:hypothetical protein
MVRLDRLVATGPHQCAAAPSPESSNPNSPDAPEVRMRPLSTNTRGLVARLLPPAPPKPQRGLTR